MLALVSVRRPGSILRLDSAHLLSLALILILVSVPDLVLMLTLAHLLVWQRRLASSPMPE